MSDTLEDDLINRYITHARPSFDLWWVLRNPWWLRRRAAKEAYEFGVRVGAAMAISIAKEAVQKGMITTQGDPLASPPALRDASLGSK